MHYPHVVDVSRKGQVDDSQGGDTETYAAAHLTDERCRISKAGTGERQVAQQEHGVLTHVIYFQRSRDVQRGDRLTVTQGPGATFEVLNVQSPSKLRYQIANCEEVVEANQ